MLIDLNQYDIQAIDKSKEKLTLHLERGSEKHILKIDTADINFLVNLIKTEE